jgi:sarcosine oxidase/L-pipecolate oxidase
MRGEDNSPIPDDGVPTLTTLTSAPSINRLGEFEDRTGYLNPHSGWAEAERALTIGLRRVCEYGGVIRTGCEVRGLVEEENGGKMVVKGVELTDGERAMGDLVIIATGAWTPALFAQDGMEQLPQVIATG